MKVIEIAKKNKITSDEIISVCKELGIVCENEESTLSDNDLFYIEKRISTLKAEKLSKQAKMQQQAHDPKRKIKLKRKVSLKPETKTNEIPVQEAVTVKKNDTFVQKEIVKEPQKEIQKETVHKETDHKETANKEQRRSEFPKRDNFKKDFQKRDSSHQKNTSQGNFQQRTHGNQQGAGRQQFKTDRPFQKKFEESRNTQTSPLGVIAADTTVAVDEKIDVKKSFERSKKSKDRDKEKETRKITKDEKNERESITKHYFQKKKKTEEEELKPKEIVTPKYIEITENILVGDLAKKLNIKANELISRLMKLGVMATINQVLDSDTAEIIASEFGTTVKTVTLYDETVIRDDEVIKTEDYVTRAPIVTVMGHVDHGKTKLLDAIRSTNVAEGEFGGITQHIGAYQVNVKGQNITFLDTPGHAAFTTMRARGAKITDIVILVVAANDGVMPQTIEAINHAKAANVPIIVAINKIDLPEANPTKVKQELTAYELIPEEWGGQTLFVEISAKQKTNINGLLEMILIQSEMLELKANFNIRARGTVIESRLDAGRGSVSTLLVQNGVLKIGDPFVVGIYSAKVRAMFNDKGDNVTEAGPSMPVEVLGVDGIPSAGDPFQVVSSEKYSKQIAQKRQELKRIESAKQVKKVNLENLNEMIMDGQIQEVKIIIKADVDGSVQALRDALEKLSNTQVRVKVIHSAAGGINESDIMLASASDAIIIGYHVRPSPRIAEVAEKEKVSIKTFNIIFEVTDSIKKAMEGMLTPDIKEEVTGAGEIRQLFKISKVGTIAGSIVTSGRILRANRIRLLRDGVIVFDGELKSLKRFKDDASEVEVGQECGIGLEKFNDIKVGDTFESYRNVEIAQKLE